MEFKLNTGVSVPTIGFGTWQITPDDQAQAMVAEAISAGYRVIDTAKIYGNESGVGAGVRQSGVAREDLFITTKLWNDEQGYDSTHAAFNESLQKLGLDYVDLYLIHWPSSEKRHDSWKALQDIAADGRAKAIGVSNYNVEQLQQVLDMGGTPPAVNQIELHPHIYHEQKAIIDFCAKQGILVEAYSPLAQAGNLEDEIVSEIAKSHDVSSAQVLLRWCVQHGTLPIPRSTNPGRIAQNIDIFGFELTTDDMKRLDDLEQTGSVL